jgi:tRNA (mo5U34)-methyltransferase
MSQASEEVRAQIAERDFWYHTIDVAPGISTPGVFDLRPIVDRIPWPDVRGKRCLDVGPYDGFLSFELERRGAAEVVATDISHPSEWDWPIVLREQGTEVLDRISGAEPGAGFEVAKRILGSSVERVEVNAYDLSPDTVGKFDVVVCGSLMLHLRDPVRALEAIRSVCNGEFLSSEQISPPLSLLGRRRPLAQLRGGVRCQWWIPNQAGHRLMVESAGFEIERTTRPYSIELGEGHPERGRIRGSSLRRIATRIATRGQDGSGVLHAALLARPV